MPTAEDKVVLEVLLKVQEFRKELQKTESAVKKSSEKIAKYGKPIERQWQRQSKELQGIGDSAGAAAAKYAKSEASKAAASAKATGAIAKQRKEFEALGKVGSSLGKMFASIGKSVPGAMKAGVQGTAAVGKTLGRVGVQVGSGIFGFIMGGVQSAYQSWAQYGQAQMGMAGMGTRAQFGARKMQRGPQGVALGYRMAETAQHAAMAARATGNLGAVGMAQQFARAGGGMAPGEAIQMMGGLRQAGVKFGGGGTGPFFGKGGQITQEGLRERAAQRQGSRELAGLIKGGMISGLEKARLPEYLQGVSQIAEMVGGRQAGRVDVGGIGARMAMLGQVPGMQGRRGMQLGQRLDQMITGPGGGEAGQALMLQAFGFGKPGGTSTYYDAVKRQQRGFMGKGGGQNLMDVFKEVYKQYGVAGGGGSSPQQQEANLVMNTLSGIQLDTVEAIGDVFNSNQDQQSKLAKIKELMAKSAPLDQQVLTANKAGFHTVASALASIDKQLIANGGVIGGPMLKIQRQLLNEQQKAFPAIAGIMRLVSEWIPRIGRAIEGVWKFFGGSPDKDKADKPVNEFIKQAKESYGKMLKAPTVAKFGERASETQQEIQRMLEASRKPGYKGTPTAEIESLFKQILQQSGTAAGLVRSLSDSDRQKKLTAETRRKLLKLTAPRKGKDSESVSEDFQEFINAIRKSPKAKQPPRGKVSELTPKEEKIGEGTKFATAAEVGAAEATYAGGTGRFGHVGNSEATRDFPVSGRPSAISIKDPMV